MIRICAIVLTTLAVVSPAPADEYWVAYEGNNFPENVGWNRTFTAGGATRRIEDGALVIDSTESRDISDWYQTTEISDPGPAELFIAEWRVRLDQFDRYDALFTIARDTTPGHTAFLFGDDNVWILTDSIVIDVEPYRWHEYRLTSRDMDSFDLFIDGKFVHAGSFESQSFLQSFVAFGDGGVGASSLSRWDYVRFGVVPEPSSATMWMLILFHLRTWRFVR